jgi:hypothetical protein
MSVRIFSCLCVSVFSFLDIPNLLSAIKYLSFCHVIFVYLYHILLMEAYVVYLAKGIGIFGQGHALEL